MRYTFIAIADNILERCFQADRPNQKWLADFSVASCYGVATRASACGTHLSAKYESPRRRFITVWLPLRSHSRAVCAASLQMCHLQKLCWLDCLRHLLMAQQYSIYTSFWKFLTNIAAQLNFRPCQNQEL